MCLDRARTRRRSSLRASAYHKDTTSWAPRHSASRLPRCWYGPSSVYSTTRSLPASVQRRRRPSSVMISFFDVSTCSRICPSLHGYAQLSGRSGDQFTSLLRFIRLTRPVVQGWLGLASRCSMSSASKIMWKRMDLEMTVLRFFCCSAN